VIVLTRMNLKKDFPVFKDNNLVYLDTAASSLTPKCVIDAVSEYYLKYPVNVHRGVYRLSFEATRKYEAARENIAQFINARFEEIIFTRGASSALNLVALSYGMKHINAGDEIIVSELEHHSSVLPWQNVANQKGAVLKYVPLDQEGRITVENFKQVLSNKTKVVALTHVSNVMGYVTPLESIIKLAHEKGAIVTVDAAQSAPHMALDVKVLDADFLSFSGHKMLGPTGVGVLYGKYELFESMDPLEYGGDMIDEVNKTHSTYKNPPYKFETGTPPIAEVIGLSEAINYLKAIGFDAIHSHETELTKQAIEGLKAIEGIEVYNPTTDTGIITFNLTGVHPHDAVSYFDEDNIALRAGHHCAQLLMKYLDVAATLRASFYLYNTTEDVQRFIKNVKAAREFFTEVGF